MERTLRHLMDAFLQHLSSRREAFWFLRASRGPLEGWLAGEWYGCLAYLVHLSRFRRLGGDRRPHAWTGREDPIPPEGTDVGLILWPPVSLEILVSFHDASWPLDSHLERLHRRLKGWPASPERTRLLLEVMISRGKYAIRTLEDCAGKIEESLGMRFNPYKPYLDLTPYGPSLDPLGEHVLMRLYFTVMGG